MLHTAQPVSLHDLSAQSGVLRVLSEVFIGLLAGGVGAVSATVKLMKVVMVCRRRGSLAQTYTVSQTVSLGSLSFLTD